MTNNQKKILTSSLKGLMLSEQSAIEDNYVDIKYGEKNVGKPITGGYYLMATDESSMNGKRALFFAMAQITKDPGSDHYFMQDYYLGKRIRVENALKYMLYEATKYRKFYIDDKFHSHVLRYSVNNYIPFLVEINTVYTLTRLYYI